MPYFANGMNKIWNDAYKLCRTRELKKNIKIGAKIKSSLIVMVHGSNLESLASSQNIREIEVLVQSKQEIELSVHLFAFQRHQIRK